ncbi:MAG: DUF2057 domain-containing protein [Desulfarculaceae bacterium]|nr:DUF2057 domain-containing protein [Desulfarculaceae bacterium]MCF8071958.1 DUF2057 domain-containing protein [Desulfarculaceae bacterium]MCF8101475.1 DUF2057 domain-containing protein [Desulfarculaceae bacterium]MCF8115025.1 DUF2057 domain-containing protein [Desulfarculaceae bacterium]
MALPLGLLSLLLALACAPAYLDPGPNPAKVTVRVEAKSSAEVRSARRYDSNPTWFWGLYATLPSGGRMAYPPAGGGRMPNQTAKVLKQEATFLLPPGKHKVVLRLEADLEVPDSEGSRVVAVAAYEEVLDLDLKPGQSLTLERRFGF